MTNSNSTLNNSIIPAADHQYHWTSDYSPAQPGAAPTVAAPVYRNQVLDWENAMLLAAAPTSQNSNNDQASSSIYIDQLAEYKPSIHNLMHADVIAALSSHHSRQYENLLSTNSLNSNSNGAITWPGLLNTVSSRNSIIDSAEQHENYVVQAALGAPYRSYEGTLNGAAASSIGSYSSLPVAAAGGAVFSGDILGSSRASNFGLSTFDQRRLEDILMKRELYTTHDFNSRLGLNLGGRTYFSAADDFAFGRFGKRLRPNSPGCVMQPAPLCQAEGCKADLSMAKHYHRRHKVCEYHSKASTVHIGDQTQRFCQQCSRFHVLSEFDDGKRSCRKRLADHNRRRRKPQSTPSLAVEAVPASAPAAANDESKDSQEDAATDADHSPVEVNGEPSVIKAVDNQPQPAASISPIEEYNSDEATNNNYTQRHASRRSGLWEQSNDPSTGILMVKGEPAPSITAGDRRPSTASAGVNQVVASLSLGAIETPDLTPRASAGVHHDDLLEAGTATAHFNSAPSTKSSIKMPWLQASRGSNSQLAVPAVPLINITDSKAGEQSSEYPNQYIAATSHGTDQRESLAPGDEGHSSSTWMLKSMVVEAADGVLENARHNMVKPSGNSGGHDLLHLLGTERELFNSNKHNEPTKLGSLAFLDHSLNASYKKSEQTIPFSSLQRQQQHLYDQGQLPRPPHSGGQSSASIFGSRNHWI